MAAFYVAQKVKTINPAFRSCGWYGVECVIREYFADCCFHWRVARCDNGELGLVSSSEIAPLLDPKADAFIESLKKIGPLTVKETV